MEYLVNLCIKQNDKFLSIKDIPENLDDYAVTVRYPTGIFNEVSNEDIREAYKLTLQVKKIVLGVISENNE